MIEGTDYFVRGADMQKATISGREYGSVAGAESGVMKALSGTDDTIIIQKYRGVGEPELNRKKSTILKHLSDTYGLTGNSDEIEESMMENLNEYKAFIYPFTYFNYPVKSQVCYTVCELPSEFTDKYCILDKAVCRSSFLLYARVVAALNLANIFKTLTKYFRGIIYKVRAEAFYVNTDNGEVKVIVERLLGDRECDPGNRVDYMTLEDQGSGSIEESDISRFEAYTVFRLLCMENPFDGCKTITEYPLLSKKALLKINSGEFGFIFTNNGENKYSEYIGRDSYENWKRIPSRLRDAIEMELERKTNGGKFITSDEWLKNMRVLRDCLVQVNGQYKLCDPDVGNDVLFIKVGDYSIPIWPRKAVYGYHVGIQENDVKNGVVAGITMEGYIKNHSDSQWDVTNNGKMNTIRPGGAIKPVVGMKIEINGVCLQIVDGKIPAGNHVDMVPMPDLAERPIMEDTGNIQDGIPEDKYSVDDTRKGGVD